MCAAIPVLHFTQYTHIYTHIYIVVYFTVIQLILTCFWFVNQDHSSTKTNARHHSYFSRDKKFMTAEDQLVQKWCLYTSPGQSNSQFSLGQSNSQFIALANQTLNSMTVGSLPSQVLVTFGSHSMVQCTKTTVSYPWRTLVKIVMPCTVWLTNLLVVDLLPLMALGNLF